MPLPRLDNIHIRKATSAKHASDHETTGCPSGHDGRVTHPETTSRPNKEVTRAGRKTQGLEPPEMAKHAVPHALPAHRVIPTRCEKQVLGVISPSFAANAPCPSIVHP